MQVDLSSNCECPNCLEGTQSESGWDFSSRKKNDDTLYSKSRRKSKLSPVMQRFLSQCCSDRLENDNKEDSTFLPSEGESSVRFSLKHSLNQTPEKIKRKIKPLRELTIQELLREFGDSSKFQPNSMSLSQFRDNVVVKFRRALYYSGIWVKYVQGQQLEKHFSANYFKRNPRSLYRLIPWLKRELTAVYGDYGYTVKNILAAILHHMTKFNLDSESFMRLLEPYLLQHTHHFLHEFISFVQSSYNMETYDQKAIYQCPVSTWMKNKTTASALVLPLPEDLALMISQQGAKPSKNNQIKWNKSGERPQSGLKQFQSGNYSSKNSKIPTTCHKAANAIHIWTKDKSESDDCKGTVSTNGMFLNWATSRERGSDTFNRKKNDQGKSEGIKLLPGHVQDLQKRETRGQTFSALREYNIKETSVLNPSQQIHFQKTEEKKKLEESSPKIFQRLPREKSLINSKSRERDDSYNCISENILSPTRNGGKLSSVRKNRMKCSQSSQLAEAGSHRSRRVQTQSSSRTHRSKSWCAGPRRRLISRKLSDLSLKGNHRNKHVTHNICCEPSEENVHGSESAFKVTPVQYVKLYSAAGKRHKHSSQGEGDSLTVEHCHSLPSTKMEKQRSPSMQKMKEKNMVCRAKRVRTLKSRKNKCQPMGMQTTEFSDELGDLDGESQQHHLSACITSSRKQIQESPHSSLQKTSQEQTQKRRSIKSVVM